MPALNEAANPPNRQPSVLAGTRSALNARPTGVLALMPSDRRPMTPVACRGFDVNGSTARRIDKISATEIYSTWKRNCSLAFRRYILDQCCLEIRPPHMMPTDTLVICLSCMLLLSRQLFCFSTPQKRQCHSSIQIQF